MATVTIEEPGSGDTVKSPFDVKVTWELSLLEKEEAEKRHEEALKADPRCPPPYRISLTVAGKVAAPDFYFPANKPPPYTFEDVKADPGPKVKVEAKLWFTKLTHPTNDDDMLDPDSVEVNVT